MLHQTCQKRALSSPQPTATCARPAGRARPSHSTHHNPRALTLPQNPGTDGTKPISVPSRGSHGQELTSPPSCPAPAADGIRRGGNRCGTLPRRPPRPSPPSRLPAGSLSPGCGRTARHPAPPQLRTAACDRTGPALPHRRLSRGRGAARRGVGRGRRRRQVAAVGGGGHLVRLRGAAGGLRRTLQQSQHRRVSVGKDL